MVATASKIPVVSLVRHSAPSSWTPAQRGELAARLGKLGTTITELSDARERLGFPRLSESSDWDREHCHENLESPEVQAILVQLRLEHVELVRDIGAADKKVVAQARKLLGLKAGWALRIGELRALYAQIRILEIEAEPVHRYGCTTHPVYSEEELFAGAEAL